MTFYDLRTGLESRNRPEAPQQRRAAWRGRTTATRGINTLPQPGVSWWRRVQCFGAKKPSGPTLCLDAEGRLWQRPADP
ncbi:hypothetical protein E2C01_075127 [Portunus trituberculatus]|uniref:Uncharacterized protein n=1 Tax=Portunus trituberculatus TaxID=210409 RepID=A0A5B7IG33_PORTR|nr:hypothetical protein [Portunus trituberculatus]